MNGPGLKPDDRRVRQMFALLRHANIEDRQQRLQLFGTIVSKEVTSTNDLDANDVQAIIDTLDYWKRLGEISERAAAMIAGQPKKEAPARTHDQRGHQLVRVQFEEGGTEFTYAWVGPGELQVGDVVFTPRAGLIPPGVTGTGYSMATVCGLGSDYPGTITAIREKTNGPHN